MSHPAFVRNLGACAIFAAISALSSEVVIAQTPTPPPGYFDIPAGFDFPAVLEQFASSGNISAERTDGGRRCVHGFPSIRPNAALFDARFRVIHPGETSCAPLGARVGASRA
jgi:hypothetical protein